MSASLDQNWMINMVTNMNRSKNRISFDEKEECGINSIFIICKIFINDYEEFFKGSSDKEFAWRGGFFVILPFFNHLEILIFIRFIGKF